MNVPLSVTPESKQKLKSAIFNDTLFLSKLNIMDYSLLVGIDDDIQAGIIDYCRLYSWDKKLETWAKETISREPTIISPKLYKHRFREAMGKYFICSEPI